MHKSVLLDECIKYLNIKNDSIIVDCTLGYGGHSSEILKRIPNGHLYSFDQDSEAIEYSKKRLSKISNNFSIIKSNFVNISSELKKINVESVDGILYDLGVSSPQLDETERGFSFHKDAKLDMRMDQSQMLDAHYSSSIAKGIIKNRPINTTLELVEVIKNNVPFKYTREKHPARKIFQAIRIEVNNELNVFEKSLKDSLNLLKVGGRICVITFHSLEDKMCKKIFKEVTDIKPELKNMPIIPDEYLPNYKVIKVVEPTLEEIENNPRARSAKLRVIEKVK